MRSDLVAILVLAVALGGAALGIAQQSGMHGGGMMGGGMAGGMPGGHMMAGQASAQEDGKVASIYSSFCASCHGANGHGDGPAAMALTPRPRDFADCGVMATDSDEILFKAIKDGGQGVGRSPMMPPWGQSLSDDEIHGLVGYIRSLCKK